MSNRDQDHPERTSDQDDRSEMTDQDLQSEMTDQEVTTTTEVQDIELEELDSSGRSSSYRRSHRSRGVS